jgi:hypothetical protein
MILAETVGSAITSKIAYTTTHVQPVQDIASSWGSGMSASVVADGSTKGLQMVSADNTNFGYIQPKTAIPVSPGRLLNIFQYPEVAGGWRNQLVCERYLPVRQRREPVI